MPGWTAPSCRTTADGARKRWTSIFLLGWFATVGLAADDADQTLDADFLSYLAEMETEEDDWTILESPAARQPAPASKPTADATERSPPTPPPKPEQEDQP